MYELLTQGDTAGIFQLESSGMQDLMRKVRPDSFPDIVASIALYRPGPIGSGMLDDFIARKHGQTSVVYDFEDLRPILPKLMALSSIRNRCSRSRCGLQAILREARIFFAARWVRKKPRRWRSRKPPSWKARSRTTTTRRSRKDFRPDGEVRRLRFQQVALGGLLRWSRARRPISRPTTSSNFTPPCCPSNVRTRTRSRNISAMPDATAFPCSRPISMSQQPISRFCQRRRFASVWEPSRASANCDRSHPRGQTEGRNFQRPLRLLRPYR